MDELEARMTRLADELSPTTTTTMPGPADARRRARQRSRRTAVGTTTLVAVVAVAFAGVVRLGPFAGGWTGIPAAGPGGGGLAGPPSAPSVAQGEVAVTIQDPPQNLPATLRGRISICAAGTSTWPEPDLRAEGLMVASDSGLDDRLWDRLDRGVLPTRPIEVYPLPGPTGVLPWQPSVGLPPWHEAVSAPLATVTVGTLTDQGTVGGPDLVLLIDAPRARVELGSRDGRAGQLSGQWRLVRSDGRPVRDGGGAQATFAWRCRD
jgi:hypothetical protein